MVKQRSSAQVHVTDGVGGMRQIKDLRFEVDQWPIQRIVPADAAGAWMAHLNAEIEERGWNSGSMSQLDSAENSGTLSVHTASGPSPPRLDIVWERPRGKQLTLLARPSGNPVLSMDIANGFIEAVETRVGIGKTPRAHRQIFLTYEGLPWRGELWLDSALRLGPPSKHPETLLGPQILIVDAVVEGIGQHGVSANFLRRVHELRVFLGFVLGMRFEERKLEEGWVVDVDAEGRITDCRLRHVGYVELSHQRGFPKPGSAAPISRRHVERPGLGPFGITSDMQEAWVPEDIDALWRRFCALPQQKLDHLLRAGNAYLTAQLLWPEQRTAHAAFLVVACEALKPTGKRNDDLNIYDVVATFVGPSEAFNLRQLAHHPQKVRSKHFHRGELATGELTSMLIGDPFKDPSFDEMLRTLARLSRICLLEWLRVGGNFKVVRVPRTTCAPSERDPQKVRCQEMRADESS